MHIWEKKGLGKAPFKVVGFHRHSNEGWEGNYLDSSDGIADYTKALAKYKICTCHVCGIGLKNNFLIDSADGKHFSVGCDCVQSSGDGGLITEVKGVQRTIRQIEKAAERKRQHEQWNAERRAKRDIQIVETYAEHPVSVVRLLAYNGGNEFVQDIANKLQRYGSLSDKQIEAACLAIDRYITRAERTKNAQPVPVTKERIKIKGVILSTKWKEDYYGYKRVGIVEDERGFKVWGTLSQGDIGDKIEFMARVVASDNDAKFGFFKRPTKVVIEESETE